MIAADELAALQGEFAEVARDTARLLLQADYAESDLVELDARAWERLRPACRP